MLKLTVVSKIIQPLRGFSGNQIFLMEGTNGPFVRKIGNISRNVERLEALSNLHYPVPRIYNSNNDTIDMEYIHGLDIKTYLTLHHPEQLTQFLIDTIQRLKDSSQPKSYIEVYDKKLDEIDFTLLPFTKQRLLEQLDSVYSSSNYIGDLTLENIIYSEQHGFVLIDCVTVEYDSWIFDIAKLRQDLELKWFLRNDDAMLDVKINFINQRLKLHFPDAFNDNLLILMLLRVYSHATSGSLEHNFLLEGIKRLWK